MFRARNPVVILGQAVAVGVGTIVALTLAGWPSNAAEAGWAGLAGAVVGLLIALGIEHVVRLHREVRRLQHIERESEAAHELRDEERRLWSYQLALEQRRFAVSEAHFEVLAGALREADPQGQKVPLPALLARIQVTLQAKNIDKPMPPLEEWKAPAPGQPLSGLTGPDDAGHPLPACPPSPNLRPLRPS